MKEFKKLSDILLEETRFQEQLLEVLSEERAAIVKMNQEQADKLAVRKASMLERAAAIESKRAAIVSEIVGEQPKTGKLPSKPKMSEVIAKCANPSIKMDLQTKNRELKLVAERVQELNKLNADLLHQALGVISSTLAIVRSAPGTELPTYTDSGTLTSNSPDPAFTKRRGLTTSA